MGIENPSSQFNNNEEEKASSNQNEMATENLIPPQFKNLSSEEEPREMGRTKVSADAKEKGTSFSDLVAKNISEWLKQNYGKYDNNILTTLAINYAIEQSQTPPRIID